MAPKRKATVAKTAEVVENGSGNAEPTKAKRGKAAKQVEKAEAAPEEEVKIATRSTRAKTAPVVEEKVTEVENKKEKKPRGKAIKVVAEEVAAEPESSSKAKKPIVKKKGVTEKKATPTKKAAKPKTAAKGAVAGKAKSTKGAKKDNDEMEEPKASKALAKTATRKKVTPITSDSESEPPKVKKARADGLLNQTETDYSSINFDCDKENAAAKLPNLKISSWNVSGLRAWLKKKGLEYIIHERPDILCLQETKCGREKIPAELNKLMDYTPYWCPSDKEGYAGVALLTRMVPLSVEYGIGNEEFDSEGRCITADYEQFYLVNLYVPNAGKKLVTLPQRLKWNALLKDFVDRLDEKKPVIVCGDMNVAHNEIDLANPKSNKRNAGFTQEERDGLTDFLGDDKYVDTFRRFYPDQKNAYTFWTYMTQARAKNVGWRLDYFIVSKRFMDNICDNVIRANVFGSDHCPITLYLNA